MAKVIHTPLALRLISDRALTIVQIEAVLEIVNLERSRLKALDDARAKLIDWVMGEVLG